MYVLVCHDVVCMCNTKLMYSKSNNLIFISYLLNKMYYLYACIHDIICSTWATDYRYYSTHSTDTVLGYIHIVFSLQYNVLQIFVQLINIHTVVIEHLYRYCILTRIIFIYSTVLNNMYVMYNNTVQVVKYSTVVQYSTVQYSSTVQ